MEEAIPTSNIKEELQDIIQYYIKFSLIIVLLGVICGFLFCAQSNEPNCLVKQIMLFIGVLAVIIGIVVFLFYSSYSSGFDAIWTPQMQGEIQRDERKRQITGWVRSTTGGLLLVSGIIILMMYVAFFVINT